MSASSDPKRGLGSLRAYLGSLHHAGSCCSAARIRLPSASVSPTAAAEHSAVFAASAPDLMRADGAGAADQLHHDAPLHPIPLTSHFGPAHTTPRFETVSLATGDLRPASKITSR
jgi:hypothetical protein